MEERSLCNNMEAVKRLPSCVMLDLKAKMLSLFCEYVILYMLLRKRYKNAIISYMCVLT